MSTEPMSIVPETEVEELAMTNPGSDIESTDFNSSDMSDEEEDEVKEDAVPTSVEVKTQKPKAKTTKAKAQGDKAPRKKAIKKEKAVKVKKPRLIRRPYKSMDYEKLVTKQAVASGRFEVVSKRMTSTQNQLERFNYELAIRNDTTTPSEESTQMVPPV